MTLITRRSFALSALATSTLSACGNGIGGNGAAVIDSRVESTISFMYDTYPGTRDLANKASGMLVMPVITEAGLGLGGSYGRGALRIGQTTVDYYSSAAASAGLQIGAQQFSTVLFFMTEEALTDFRRANGWAAGADIEYALRDDGQTLRAETTTSLAPVIAVVFAQAGFRAGATIEGTKYTRIIP
ncbi:twin-arginine translocation pathway signal [Octadecabacter sp. CECT 8868]|uniref:lipid-binding SYLF domain-containing protein n=1 Tax=Octadecabacter algicola TaxID=2909342 RepID=UPI001EFF283C|nr:YSC84-related protein [Octadecabacter algicola]MCF2904014.1 twin-arginine translocation pathway signal [Octadecabacter algicola]